MEHNLEQGFHTFGNLDFIARQVVEGFITGLHKSPFHGFSVEFAEHRLYNTGESVKNIDWKLYARTDKLFVKRFEEETNLRCQIIIDASSSMYYPEKDFNKMQFAVYSAAALVYLLKKQRDAFGLSIFSDKLQFSSSAKSTTIHQKLIFSELEKLLNQPPPRTSTAVADALHHIAEQIHKRSLVILFSDMMDSTDPAALFSALQHLKHNKHEVILFHVMEQQKEIDFDFDNRPYVFIDKETGEEVKVHPNMIRESYLQSIVSFRKELALKCGQYGIDLVNAPIQDGFNQVLTSYLMKRSKMS